jgi:macrolide transport system ATP-binding/permease protein
VPIFLYGTTPSFLHIRGRQTLAAGRPFTDRDVETRAAVCLLGPTVARELFGEESPLGKEVRVQAARLQVVGVLGRKGANAMGLDHDDLLIAPWTTVKFRILGQTAKPGADARTDPAQKVNSLSQFYPSQQVSVYPPPTPQAGAPSPERLASVDQILVQARSLKHVEPAARQVREILRERHRLAAGEPDDFNIRDSLELLKALGVGKAVAAPAP